MLTGAGYGNELLPATLGAFAPGSAKDTVSVLPQHLESAVLATAGPRGWIHPLTSAVRFMSECVIIAADQANPQRNLIERMFCRLKG